MREDQPALSFIEAADVLAGLVHCLSGWPAALDGLDGHLLALPRGQHLRLDVGTLRQAAQAVEEQARVALSAVEDGALR